MPYAGLNLACSLGKRGTAKLNSAEYPVYRRAELCIAYAQYDKRLCQQVAHIQRATSPSVLQDREGECMDTIKLWEILAIPWFPKEPSTVVITVQRRYECQRRRS